MSDKKYPVVKKVSLAGLSEGWDESCYAYVVPANYEDQKELAAMDLTKKSESAQVDYQLTFVKERFISGKIRVFNGADFEEADMLPEHTAASVGVTDRLYAGIMGFELDPKDIRKAAVESALLLNEVNATETSSSEESPAA